MTGFIVTRLGTRGRDRVRVAREDGSEQGWIDLRTGDLTVSPGGDAELIDLAVRAWAAREHLTLPALDPPDDLVRILAAPPGPAELPVPEPHRANHFPPDVSRSNPAGQSNPAAQPNPTAQQNPAAQPRMEQAGAASSTFAEAETDDDNSRDDVASRLDRLGDVGWQVLHDVPFGPSGARLDHLLIGPGGVFTMTCRAHRGRRVWIGSDEVMVDGHPVNHLLDARADADVASRLLSDATQQEIQARPNLVIIAGAIGSGLAFLQPPPDVAVLRLVDLPDHFERRSGSLTADQIAAIADAARRPATWH